MKTKSKKLIIKKDRFITPILGIGVYSGNKKRLLNRAWEVLNDKVEAENKVLKPNYLLIVTPNPEILSRAQKDFKLAEILNEAGLAIPDGIGILAGWRFLGMMYPKTVFLKIPAMFVSGLVVGASLIFAQGWLKNGKITIPGRVLALDLIKLCAKSNKKVFLLGGKPGSAEIALKNLKNRFGKLNIQTAVGPLLDNSGFPQNKAQKQIESEVINNINVFKPDLLLVGFGAPKQEKWLDRMRGVIDVKIGMAVGGMIDYTAKILPPPPRAFKEAGFEWVWRLFLQPSRIFRIFTAVIVFPWQVFVWKTKN